MNIIVIHIGEIYKYPPVISLLKILSELKIKTTVITTQSEFVKNKLKNVTFNVLPFCYEKLSGPFIKFFNMFRTKVMIERILSKIYNGDSIIWVTYNVSLKHLDLKKLLKRKYILQFMELSEELLYFKNLPFKMNAELLSNKALAVVVPEYNRAHITKAWWNINKLPFVLPNKPYYDETISKYSRIDDSYANKVFERLKNKKVILYQGVISKERPIIPFIKAVDELGSEYALVVMSSEENIFTNIDSSNFYYIPFVKPPKHLQITSNAFMGILSYVPAETGFSKLNALYCAPNKIFEYSMFGIPMIGNDIPGLKFFFETSRCGKCFKSFNERDIKETILEIRNKYEYYSNNSSEFFSSVDNRQKIKEILWHCQNFGNHDD